jgi:hypothetical protein
MPRIALAIMLFAPVSARAADDAKTVEFFESKIRPVLVEHCYKCHADDADKPGKIKGGLRLDTRANWQKGGDTGAAIVPGKPGEGTLLKALRYDAPDLKMPPKGKLPDAVIADFEKWVRDGAADPRGDAAVKPAAGIDIEKGKQFWSFVAPKEPAVPKLSTQYSVLSTPVDAFIAAEWEKRGLKPVPLADPRTLIRRVYLDLIGLPPTPEEVDAFVRDSALSTQHSALEKVVDKLLADSHHGEKWARHWLDVARYAEDQAHTFGVRPKTQAWRYRDWVIAALNADIPYDQFVKLQIAGDMLPDAPADAFTRYAGLGFLGLGAEYYRDAGCGLRADADELDDKVDTITRGLLGLTVACARCHDHKFDPIPTRDYYALAGVYFNTKLTDAPLCPPEEMQAYNAAQNRLKSMADLFKKAQADAKARPDDKGRAAAAEYIKAEADRLKKEMPPLPAVAHVVSGNGPGMPVYVRGNPTVKGEAVPKGFLRVLPCSTKSGPDFNRLELADAIASKDNPLTARVIVNRVWAWHFGRGLVSTPSNFGSLGERPSHPELLDWLAVNFMKNGWSLKWLHKQIVLSGVYQLSSNTEFGARSAEPKTRVFGFVVPSSALRDPRLEDAANVYLWRANRRRLDIELWRDSLLAVSGNLDPRAGGPTFDLKDPNAKRRTVYARISRHELDGLLRLFDFPDANVTADKRVVTTVPQQQLFALNSEFMATQAKAFAARVEKLGTTDAERIAAAYRLAFGRAPESREVELAERFLKLPPKPGDKLTRWQQYAQVLLASNELMYVD